MSKSQSDIVKVLAGGTGANVPTKGEFVFIKNASGKVRVIIHNEPVEMEAGDLRRVENPFDSFEIINLSSVEQRIEIVAGFGEYNRLVVRGDISSFSSLLDSSGVPVIDNRVEDTFVFSVVDDTQRVEIKYNSVDVGFPGLVGVGSTQKIAYYRRGVWVSHDGAGLKEYNKAGELIGSYSAVPNFTCWVEHPSLGLCAFKDSNLKRNELLQYAGAGEFREVSSSAGGTVGNELYAVLSNGVVITCQSTQIWIIKPPIGSETVREYETNFADIEGFPYGGGLSDIFPDPTSINHFFALYGNELYRFTIAGLEQEFKAEYIDNVVGYSGTAGTPARQVYFSYSLNMVVNAERPRAEKLPLDNAVVFGRASINKGSRLHSSELKSIEIVKNSDLESLTLESSTVGIVRAVVNGLRRENGLGILEDVLDYVFKIEVDGNVVFNGGVESAKRRGVSDLVLIGSIATLKISYRPEVFFQ